jgi:uncharacterized cupredoxin-like copper-binding protein
MVHWMLKRIVLILVSLSLLSGFASQSSQPATELTVEMIDFAYAPSSIALPAGQPVTLTLKNTGKIEHDFVVETIDATTKVIQDNGSDAHRAHSAEQNYDLHISARPGETSIVQLTIAKSGTYQIICSVEGHKEAGIIGELIVLEQE